MHVRVTALDSFFTSRCQPASIRWLSGLATVCKFHSKDRYTIEEVNRVSIEF
jgi:hypothetical protein